MSLDRTVAHFVTHRRRAIYVALALLIVGSVLLIVFRGGLASDVLDMLPQHFDSVQTFKRYDREFSQARELTFGLHDPERKCDMEGFAEHFGEMLRAESWVVRVMDRSPMETPAGVHEVQSIALPLLLNLEPAEFAEIAEKLAPAQIDARLTRLRAELEAGSPRAEFELGFDPLGVIVPALKPLAGSFAMEQTHPLTSPDGTLRVVLVITNQHDLGAHACQALMRQVEDFKTRVLASWNGEKPEILVTGRTPYVAELSLKMRADVVATVGSSALMVGVIFWLGFRQLRLLFAIMHVLLLCCLLSVALGALVFRELNMITIGLCGILIGLGEDFGMMLFALYQAEREAGHDHMTAVAAALRHHSSGILFGALTTAAAFLALLLSESTGFIQLGVLIACGILFCAFFMMTLFFVFLGDKHRPQTRDPLRAGGSWLIKHILARPRAVLVGSSILLLALTAFCFAPIGRLRFEANPRSLEPRDSRAGAATRTITEKMPAAGEPIIVMVEGRDPQDFHEKWERLRDAWTRLVEQGRIKSIATPAAFAISPARVLANTSTLAMANPGEARTALTQALTREGLNADSFASAFALLDALAAVAQGNAEPLNWRQTLPQSSSWWFVIEHFLGDHPTLGVGYVTPVRKLDGERAKAALREMLIVPGIEMHLSGWSYTLAELAGWSKTKLLHISSVMIVFNAVLLLVLFRRVSTVAIVMIGLALSMGALVATLKVCGVALNLFNVLAFALVLGVGVDYGIYVALAARERETAEGSLAKIAKPVLLCGLTTAAGFLSLVTATNPALSGLGIVCGVGVAWCLFSTFFFIVPGCVLLERGRAIRRSDGNRTISGADTQNSLAAHQPSADH